MISRPLNIKDAPNLINFVFFSNSSFACSDGQVNKSRGHGSSVSSINP